MSRAKRQIEAKQHKHTRSPIRPVIGKVDTELAKAARMKSETTESKIHIGMESMELLMMSRGALLAPQMGALNRVGTRNARDSCSPV